MNVLDFEGQQHKWPPTKYRPSQDDKSKSSHHLRARRLLKRTFSAQPIMEEVLLPGTRLRLDFYIHSHRIAVEVHGEQHYSYSPFFHGSALGFIQSRHNDRIKLEWCELNQIIVVELPHNESEEEWTKRLQELLVS